MIHHGCRRPTSATACHKPRTIQTVQPFPQDGPLVHNLNTPLPVLVTQLRGMRERTVSYVVATVKYRRKPFCSAARSAPNFQGGVLTLCTCKHQMRASQFGLDGETPTWIAGFTGRTIHEGRHWLFYLAKIQSVHEAPSDLWKSCRPLPKSEKSARRHFLGDLFKPKTKSLGQMPVLHLGITIHLPTMLIVSTVATRSGTMTSVTTSPPNTGTHRC